MANNYMTPGVYIEEKDAFPGSVVEVATAIPAFIGYTEKADRNGRSLQNKPTRITSFADYALLFGGAFTPKFTLKEKTDEGAGKHVITIKNMEKAITYNDNHELYMYRSIQLFFSNGGGTCYIVSVGTYGDKPNGIAVKMAELLGESKVDGKVIEGGLKTLLKEQESTMVVVPDAVKLDVDECYAVYGQVLGHCAKMQSRVAIFDIHNGAGERIEGGDEDVIKIFRDKIGTEFLNYGAAYYPWLNTSIVPKGEINFMNFDDEVDLKTYLSPEESKAKELLENFKIDDDTIKEELKKSKSEEYEEASEDEERLSKLVEAYKENKIRNHHQGLVATSPTYVNLLAEMTEVVNLLPPSSAMAGLYTMVDNIRGVWKSPANISVKNVIKPSSNITHDNQELLNVDAMSGKSINAIRTFPGVGTMVWGGRTLDGNSLDWRYINVRRTIIMLEQSIKLALRAYVFEPNDANTWVTVKSMIVNFLTEKWKQGALAGSTPEDAFDVQIGLGNTMTGVDILEGKMLVTIKLAIVRPAEFIVVTFQQQMQKS